MQRLIGKGGSGHRIQQLGKAGFRQVMGLFLAQNCPVCDRPATQTFCLDCQRQIYPATHPHTDSDHRSSDGLSEPLPKPFAKPLSEGGAMPSLPVWALGSYSGSLKRAILAMKYGDRPDVARPLGAALAQHWLAQSSAVSTHAILTKPIQANASEWTPASLCAVPIPLHAQRYNSRGFNQAELIARAFCQVSELPLLPHGLIRVQATRPQHELGLAERQQNLEQVFQVGPSLCQRFLGKAAPAVLLVDDIYTTGATAQSAAAVLQQAGISVAGIAAVAKAGL